MDREYLIRVTRSPLTPEQRKRMESDGTLPADWRSRSVEEHDFVNVNAPDDLAACRLAKRDSDLTFAGEPYTCHEVMGDGSFRLITTDLDFDLYDAT